MNRSIIVGGAPQWVGVHCCLFIPACTLTWSTCWCSKGCWSSPTHKCGQAESSFLRMADLSRGVQEFHHKVRLNWEFWLHLK